MGGYMASLYKFSKIPAQQNLSEGFVITIFKILNSLAGQAF